MKCESLKSRVANPTINGDKYPSSNTALPSSLNARLYFSTNATRVQFVIRALELHFSGGPFHRVVRSGTDPFTTRTQASIVSTRTTATRPRDDSSQVQNLLPFRNLG